MNSYHHFFYTYTSLFHRYDAPVTETEKYIDRIIEGEERYDLYMELCLYKKAADAAIKIKSAARLQEVSKFTDEIIDRLIFKHFIVLITYCKSSDTVFH